MQRLRGRRLGFARAPHEAEILRYRRDQYALVGALAKLSTLCHARGGLGELAFELVLCSKPVFETVAGWATARYPLRVRSLGYGLGV
jgi:hypothetical protein